MGSEISDKKAQSLRALSGAEFEGRVAYVLNQFLNREDIYAVSLKELKRLIKTNQKLVEILEYAKLPIRNPCEQKYEMVLPDTDVIVYYKRKDHSGNVEKNFQLATVSCKVSFHGRETESTFWAHALRDHGAKFVFATEDKFNELKTCENGNKARRLLESYMDSVYLMSRYGGSEDKLLEDINRFHYAFENSKSVGYQRQNTRIFDVERKDSAYCKQVRPFDDLLFDLMRWKFERTK